MNVDIGILWSSICGLIEFMQVHEEKISPICSELPHDVNATEGIWQF